MVQIVKIKRTRKEGVPTNTELTSGELGLQENSGLTKLFIGSADGNSVYQIAGDGYHFKSIPTSLTPNLTDSSTKLATTEYVKNTALSASNITTGSLADARLSGNVTLQGNSFNSASKLVQLDANSKYPALDGSLITNLSASNITNNNLPGKSQWDASNSTHSSLFSSSLTGLLNGNTTPVDLTPILAQFTATSVNPLFDIINDGGLRYIKATSFRDRYTPLAINIRAEGSVSSSNERRFIIYFQRKDGLIIFGGDYIAGADGINQIFTWMNFNINVGSDINAGNTDGWFTQGYRIFLTASNSNLTTSISFTKIQLRIQHLS
jgi:hypothetical protein